MDRGFLETDIMGIILFVILYFQMNKMYRRKTSIIYLQRVMCFTSLSMALNIFFHLTNGVVYYGCIPLSYITMELYFIFIILAVYNWMYYTYIRLTNSTQMSTIERILSLIPAAILLVMVLLTPYTRLIFYINDKNEYVRGTYYPLQLILNYGYVCMGAYLSFRRYKVELLQDKKDSFLRLCFYSVILLIGGLLQGLFYGLNTAVVTIVIAIVLIYIDRIKEDASLDYLTKLYNRKQFDFYLNKKISIKDEENLYLIFFDIDDFKQINDLYGHLEGDHAIILISELLQEGFLNTNAFIARYGGDEFAIVISIEEAELLKHLNYLTTQLEKVSAESKYKLSLSAGYSKYTYESNATIENFIHSADKNMYHMKQTKKSNSTISLNRKNEAI